MSIRAVVVTLCVWTCACGGGGRAAQPAAEASEGEKPTVAVVAVTTVHPALDGARAESRDQTVVIAGDRIVAAGPAATTTVPRGARVIDGHGKWLMPGLVDSHVHFFQSGNPYTRPDVADFTNLVPYADEVKRNKARLATTFKIWLASGVTSVVDTGGPMWNFDVRDAAAKSDAAPRVQIAGPLVSMVDRPKLELDDPPIIKVNTIDEAKTLVSRELARHPDFVKVWFIRMPERKLEDDEAIVRAVAEQTHAAKLRLLVHATELDTAKAALRAGADILVHSVFDKPVDDEFIALAKQRNIIFIPTLWVMPGYRAVLGSKFEPTDEERRLGDPQILDALAHAPPPAKAPMPIEPAPAAMDSLPRLWAAGIVIALGTDAGNIGTLHGPSVFREARLMQKAGLTVPQVLRAGTVNGAKVLGLDSELGDVAAGRRADLVLVDADPLVSIDAWSHASFVIRAGRVFSPAELMASAR